MSDVLNALDQVLTSVTVATGDISSMLLSMEQSNNTLILVLIVNRTAITIWLATMTISMLGITLHIII